MPSNINAIYMYRYTFSGLQFCRWQYRPIFIRLAIVASSLRNSEQNLKISQFKVIQGYRPWYQSERICNYATMQLPINH